MKRLTAYIVDGHDVAIRPAPLERDWMDASGQRFAYRCLPLNIANTHGWEILCPAAFSAGWDGGETPAAIEVRPEAGATAPAASHFGGGVLTFHVPCIFRTDPGVDLFVSGPINRPKHGIAPLTGIVETDWSPYSFTMNWIFTRPRQVARFAAGEPFCHVFPIQRGALEAVDAEARLLSEDPQLEAEHRSWTESRNDFNRDLKVEGSKATQDRWQKSYFRGISPLGRQAPNGHMSRLRLRPFRRGMSMRTEDES